MPEQFVSVGETHVYFPICADASMPLPEQHVSVGGPEVKAKIGLGGCDRDGAVGVKNPMKKPYPVYDNFAKIAQQTVAVCQTGEYTNAHGEAVPLRAAIDGAVNKTKLHEVGDVLHDPVRGAKTAITVTAESTIAALVRLAAQPGGHLACLNFASAKNPGGGFLAGSQAQEESLARSSGLYPCLLSQLTHYARNRAHRSAIYLDLAIWSPQVPFFRTDDGSWFDQPVLASVITCAAPNASALRSQDQFNQRLVEAALCRRAAFVLAIAAHHKVERLVLGAWGAGVFGNDPDVVADVFGALLDSEFVGVFTEVVFAVMGGPGNPNRDAFDRRFSGSFSGAIR